MFAINESVVPGQNELPVCLWKENPSRLVSLWAIMQRSRVAELLVNLRSLWISSFLGDINGPEQWAAVANLKKQLVECKELCEAMGLRVSGLHVQDAINLIDLRSGGGARPFSVNGMERLINVTSSNIEKEASLLLFFTLDPDKAKLYESLDPFGESTGDAFPSAKYDTMEACKSFALGRNTACVFHLMRVLEIGLTVLAKQFNIPGDHTNWETIINQIEKAIGNIGNQSNRPANWKDERELYSQCASHFRVVKDAWRNYTAHARGKYDEQEALDMLGNVRGFMQRLATRLHE